MKLSIFEFRAELAESKKILAYNQTLVCLGAHLSKLNVINQQPTLIDVDQFYAVSRALISQALPEVISLRCGLMVGAPLKCIGINDNKIMYEILNGIPSPSCLRCVVKNPVRIYL